MQVGVLAVQGAFIEHIQALHACGINAKEVRAVDDLEKLEGLIMPGGESTAIRKLINWNNLKKKILENAANGMKFFGTCAGAVLLAKEIVGENKKTFGLIDVSVDRNAYGRQLNSFEADLKIKGIGEFHGVFIRAPVFSKIGESVSVLAEYDEKIVMVENENCLITSFHPELTEDTRVHKYFLNKVKNS